MNELYRSVEELPESALQYLSRIVSCEGSTWYDKLSDEDRAIVDACEYADGVPNDVLFRVFDGVLFVPEDFNGDAGDDWDLF